MEITFKGKKKTYRLTHDGSQFTLSEKVKATTGKMKGQYVYSNSRYYSQIEHVLEKVLHLEISDSDAHSFAELFAAITEAKTMISTLVSENTEPPDLVA